MRRDYIRPLIINQVPQSYYVYKFLVNLFNARHIGDEAEEMLDQSSISAILDSLITDQEIDYIFGRMNAHPGIFYYLLVLPVLPFDFQDVENAIQLINDGLGKETLIKSNIHHDFDMKDISGYVDSRKPNVMFCIVPSEIHSLIDKDVNGLRLKAKSLLSVNPSLRLINLIETIAYIKLLEMTGRIPSRNSLELTSTRFFNSSAKEIDKRFFILELYSMSDGTLIIDNSSVYDKGGARFVLELWPK